MENNEDKIMITEGKERNGMSCLSISITEIYCNKLKDNFEKNDRKRN